jgi:hypothetical protein
MNPYSDKTFLLIIAKLLIISFGCTSGGGPTEVQTVEDELISEVDSARFNTGILLYNADQGKQFWTEFNTQVRPYNFDNAKVVHKRKFNSDNPYLELTADGGEGSYGMRMSVFKTLFDDHTLPPELSDRVNGLSFNAFAFEDDTLFVEILDASNNVISEGEFELEAWRIKTYNLTFESTRAKEIVIYSHNSNAETESRIGIDDVYLKTNDDKKFNPPASDAEFLSWLKQASFNFFDWNYEQLTGDKGIILESYTDDDKISLSGIGYAYAIYILAAEEGYITSSEAKQRVKSMIHWQVDQNWFDGSGGWNGFPHHYFKKDGSYLWNDVSTIDWAICAAGLRVAKQYYSDDQEISEMVDTLLSRPDWTTALAEDDKIAMGFDENGEINDFRWGLAFSEETEIVYLEAVASGDLDPSVFDRIIREKQDGFYPSWFGAGFTYNWLQLWTGPREPYKTNSIAAYNVDASTCYEKFGVAVMGLTACSTINEEYGNGFFTWNRYISNQGGLIRLNTGSVVQISPAPYGAALALPFTYEKAITALRTFTEMGYYHEYLGLPDNVRMRNVPDDLPSAPNWDTFDINIGPMIMAIEQINENRIADLYLSDQNISSTLTELINSFPEN